VKSIYVTDLTDGDDLLNEPFLVQDVARRETKDGRPYLLETFRDKTGQIGGVFWDVPPDVDDWIRPGIVTMVTGRVSNYKGTLQISTTDLNPVNDPNMENFLPSSKRSREEMVVELQGVIDGLSQPWKGLVGRILLEPAFMASYVNAPAARIMHHAYVGGLLEHTLSMVKIGRLLAKHYPYVNKDLLVSGILLHDMGKAIEYTTGPTFDFTEDGRLIGHISRAAILIELAAKEMGNFPAPQLQHLIHLVLSHHGIQEWGSPVVPKTLEAVLLHQIDLLDSRVQGFFDHLRNDSGGEVWTVKSSLMFSTELKRPPGFE
jgi:3'-5' exoribonuclease